MVSFSQWSVDCIISKRMACACTYTQRPLNTQQQQQQQQPNTAKFQFVLLSCGFSFFHYPHGWRVFVRRLFRFFISTSRKISKYFNNRIRLFSFNTISFPYAQINWMRAAIPSTRDRCIFCTSVCCTAIHFIFPCFIVQCWRYTCTCFISPPSNFHRTIMVVNCSNRSWCCVVVDCRKQKEEEEEEELKQKKYP